MHFQCITRLFAKHKMEDIYPASQYPLWPDDFVLFQELYCWKSTESHPLYILQWLHMPFPLK